MPSHLRQILFSVIIPLYNKMDTIERTVRSVWAQDCQDYELIIVNDGSTDNSLDVVQKLSKERPMVVIDKANGGVSSARNAGAKVSTGKYIALLDGDDVWRPSHLRNIEKAITLHPTIQFFGAGYERHSAHWRYFTIPWGGYKIEDVYSTFRYAQPVNTSTIVIDKALWVSVGGFDERFSIYEDYEFFFRLGMYTKCCVIRKISGVYHDDAKEQATRQHKGLSRETRPHIAFVDEKIRDGDASRQMISFARTQLGLLLCNAYLSKDSFRIKHLARLFPYIVASHPFLNSIKEKRCFLNYIRCNLFLIYYKIRCHMIIWRNHE